MDCLFCKILNKDIPADIIYEDDKLIAFNDINPQAKIHFLVISKTHYTNILDAPKEIISHIYEVINKIVKDKGISKSGFRVVTNINNDGGQTVFHLHFHVIGGQKLSDKMA